jgi:GNAT superfamily N-acetyltransferase
VDNLTCREYRSADVEDLLSIRNAIFPPLTVEQWRATEPDMTASLAYLEDEIVGAIPLDQRDFLAAPGAPLRAAFENAVGTREDMRSKGVGGAMIECAKHFLADRCDMLLVYRGGERSAGYRFYEKSGHRDLLYVREALWRPHVSDASGAVLGLDELYAEQDSVYRAFQATYAGYAGFPPRHEDYWREALGRMIYDVIPQETIYVRYPATGPLQAYIVAGVRQGRYANDYVVVDEAASLTGPAAMAQAFWCLGAEAARRNLGVMDYQCSDHPWRPLLGQLGFEESPRGLMIMGQIIRPQALFARTCLAPDLLADLRIRVWTPTTDYVLSEGDRPNREITIETKDEYLIRLLTRRLNFDAAVACDLVTLHGGDAKIAQRLSQAFPYAPWVYLHLDYL